MTTPLPSTRISCIVVIRPSGGKKMRCFGSLNEFTTGVVFALPPTDDDTTSEMERTRTWCWPAGYSAKTEFNIDDRTGRLLNGRQEALLSLSQLRELNHGYLHHEDHVLANNRVVKGGLKTVPYNEIYVRVGGDGSNVPSFETGLGAPVALFVRSATYGALVNLLRTRARLVAVLGGGYATVDPRIPLLSVTPDEGVRILTPALQTKLLQDVASNLNPFQNQTVSYKTEPRLDHHHHGDHDDDDNKRQPDPGALRQKSEELLDLDANDIRDTLTPEECARIAGGFGATDDSVAAVLLSAMETDNDTNNEPGRLQDIVNEGLSSAVRAGDYHTSRQLLILYTLVASQRGDKRQQQQQQQQLSQSQRGGSKRSPVPPTDDAVTDGYDSDVSSSSLPILPLDAPPVTMTPSSLLEPPTPTRKNPTPPPSRGDDVTAVAARQLAPPPPPPLDTDRLRSATNSDGLLSVLGAAEVLKSMQDGSAKRRVDESVAAMEEWVTSGEHSVTFRLASWRDQRVAQGDLKIAMDTDSSMMAFVSNRAVSNRRRFAEQLQEAVTSSDDKNNGEDYFQSLDFLRAVHDIVGRMNNPCLRLELLQYILGLDNRYSVAHVARSIELAATCLGLAGSSSISGSATGDDDFGSGGIGERLRISSGDD